MAEPAKKPVTDLLLAWNEGQPAALDELMPFVYGELRRLAQHFLSSERPGHTLEPTITTGLRILLFAIEMPVRQLRQAKLILFFQRINLALESTYFSMDGGLNWCQLGEPELACLIGEGCNLDGSTYYRIRVTPE